VDSILRAILRCGMFELVARRDVPAKVVIDEYIAVAGAFFGGDEPGFVNAVLDSLARRKRAKEFGLPVPEGEIEF
jgi:N utilization substance protein B